MRLVLRRIGGEITSIENIRVTRDRDDPGVNAIYRLKGKSLPDETLSHNEASQSDGNK